MVAVAYCTNLSASLYIFGPWIQYGTSTLFIASSVLYIFGANVAIFQTKRYLILLNKLLEFKQRERFHLKRFNRLFDKTMLIYVCIQTYSLILCWIVLVVLKSSIPNIIANFYLFGYFFASSLLVVMMVCGSCVVLTTEVTKCRHKIGRSLKDTGQLAKDIRKVSTTR